MNSFKNIKYGFILGTTVIGLAFLTTFSTTLPAAERPNFIIINVDDLGYADIGPYGSTLNRTPNLDRMAAEGRKLTTFYGAPSCSPSRASLMTGSYAKRVLPINGVLFPGYAEGLDPGEITIAELLKEQGYATGIIGKWHLGDQPEFLPLNQGFDYYFGLPYSNDMGPVEDGIKSDLGQPIPTDAEMERLPPALGKKNQPPLPLMRNNTVLKRVLPDDQQAIVQLYTEEAVKFLKSHQHKPFFLYLAHTAVHFPVYPGKAFAGKSKNGIYSDWVEEVDWSVGEILKAVKKLGLDEKTLIIFTSDNGGTKRASNTPLRGFKASTWEGGVREPAIARWPGKIPANSETDAVTGMIDVMPTFVKLAGGAAPTDRKIDGGDIWPLLAGKEGAKSPHDTYFYFSGLQLQAVRAGEWKLHLKSGELYNLAQDIGESTNRARENPAIVAKLRQAAGDMDDDLGLEGKGPGVRALGKAANPRPLIDLGGNIRPGFEAK